MKGTPKGPKVSVCVITFNQEQYIRQCLQSIVDQEAGFEFEVIVADDCSIDGTRAIVEEFADRYPSRIRTIFQQANTGGMKNYLDAHAAATGEYVAHLDGDDYWFPGKLQLQTDFMDAHPSCTMSGHRMLISPREGRFLEDNCAKIPVLTRVDAFYRYGNFLPHSSTMYRRDRGAIEPKQGIFCDYILHIWRVKEGEIGFLGTTLGCYRRQSSSSALSRSNVRSLMYFEQCLMALNEIDKIVKDEDEFEFRKAQHYARSMKHLIVEGQMELAKTLYERSLVGLAKKRHQFIIGLIYRLRYAVSLMYQVKGIAGRLKAKTASPACAWER